MRQLAGTTHSGLNRPSHDVPRKPHGYDSSWRSLGSANKRPLARLDVRPDRAFSVSSSQLVKISAHCDQIWKGDSGIDLKISQREMPDDQAKPFNRSRRWFIAFWHCPSPWDGNRADNTM